MHILMPSYAEGLSNKHSMHCSPCMSGSGYRFTHSSCLPGRPAGFGAIRAGLAVCVRDFCFSRCRRDFDDRSDSVSSSSRAAGILMSCEPGDI